ncbi:hypothetical protein [Spiroplasma turonicum]|uniref:Uncharacterized protein n=1 Tax=Spiroplasma turonicum TaxID=216946 RepID=A0A0K1P7E4_9MOLU|nr:hypothetical protein [Spiroplasma turonicum]AKU80226.1 hypothetical protein STURON_00980 [Spiroplasma turonicum]ALX71226.1 hypothetical protein STURO_v1c09750 [Spiroplasma turonicum]
MIRTFNKKIINLVLQFQYDIDVNDIEKIYKQINFIKEWNNNFNFIDNTVGSFENEDNQTTFLLLYTFLRYCNKNKQSEFLSDNLILELKTKFIWLTQKSIDQFSRKEVTLNLILNMGQNEDMIIDNNFLYLNIDNLKKFNYNEEICTKLIECFINLKQYKKLVTFCKEDYNYSNCPSNLNDLFEILFYHSYKKSKKLKELLILKKDAFYSKRFFYIILAIDSTDENKNIFNNIFNNNTDRQTIKYDLIYLNIILSKFDIKELESFIKNEYDLNNKINENLITNWISIFITIYEKYNGEIKAFKSQWVDKFLTNKKNKNKYCSVSKIYNNEYESPNPFLFTNQVTFLKSEETYQQTKLNYLKTYNNIEKYLFLFEDFVRILKKDFYSFQDFIKLVLNLKKTAWNFSNIININIFEEDIDQLLKFFNFNKNYLKDLENFNNLFIAFFKSLESAENCKNNLIEFNKKYRDLNNKLEIKDIETFWKEFNNCFNLINIKKEFKIFILEQIGFEVIEDTIKIIKYSDFKKWNFCLNKQYNDLISNIKSLLENNDELNKLDIINQNLKLFSILSNVIIPNNVYVLNHSLLFDQKKNFIQNYFKNHINEDKKIFYILYFIKTALLFNYRYILYNFEHIKNVFNIKELFNYIKTNYKEVVTIKRDSLNKFESSELKIGVVDEIDSVYLTDTFINYFMFFQDQKESYSFFENEFYNLNRNYKHSLILINNINFDINTFLNYEIKNANNLYENWSKISQTYLKFVKMLVYEKNIDDEKSYFINALEKDEINKFYIQEEKYYLYNWDALKKAEAKLIYLNCSIIFNKENRLFEHYKSNYKEAVNIMDYLKNKERFYFFKNLDIWSKKINKLKERMLLLK